MSYQLIERAQILLEQSKFQEAGKILQTALQQDPNSYYAMALLAQVRLQEERLKEAERLINDAISLAPDISGLHYMKGRILIDASRYDEAEQSLNQAINLDPEDPDAYAILSSLRIHQKKFQEALDYADQALEHDPSNLHALNMRSKALLKLNRKEDSLETIKEALQENPNNAFTHANFGWNLLEKGDHKESLTHFREALRLDPNNQYAQSGMVEALSAKYPIYRLFLKYSFWMGNMSSQYQWAFIIGFYFLVKFLGRISASNPSLSPFLTPLVIILALVAFSTWVIKPITNLFLRFNVYGRHLLKKEEKMSSNFVAICLAIFLAGIVSYFVQGQDRWIALAIFGFTMMVPCSVMFRNSKPKKILLLATVALALIGAYTLFLLFTNDPGASFLVSVYLFGFIGFQWGANFFMMNARE